MALVFQRQEVMDSESASNGFLTHSLRHLTSHLYRRVHLYAIMITLPEHRLKMRLYIKLMINPTKGKTKQLPSCNLSTVYN